MIVPETGSTHVHRTHDPQSCLSTSFSTRADGQIYQISLSEKGFKAIVTPYKEKQAQANT